MKSNNMLVRVMSILIVFGVLITACGAPAATQPPAPTAPPPVVQTVIVQGTPIVVTATSSAPSFQGVTINIITFTGPQIAEPLQRRAPDFERLTGAKINVITVPFSDLYQKILTDLSTGTNSYDAFVFAPQWMGDYIAGGYLEDLTDRVKSDA